MMHVRRCLILAAAVPILAGPCLADRTEVPAMDWGAMWAVGQPNSTFYLNNETLYFARNWDHYPVDSIAYGWARFDLSGIPAASTCTLYFLFAPCGWTNYCQGVRIDSVGVYSTIPGSLYDWWVDLSSGKRLADKTPLPSYPQTQRIWLDASKLNRQEYFTLGWDADPTSNPPPYDSWGLGALYGAVTPKLVFWTQ